MDAFPEMSFGSSNGSATFQSLSRWTHTFLPHPHTDPHISFCKYANNFLIRLVLCFLSLWVYRLLDLGRFFVYLIFYTIDRTLLTGDQPVLRPLPTQRTIQTQNKRTQTSMPRLRFESTIQVFERGKTVHALNGAATVIGLFRIYSQLYTI
jgi:hypothetical protein